MININIPHPPVSLDQRTLLTASTAVGATNLPVQNNVGIVANDFVVIGNMDTQERSELQQVSAVTAHNSLTIGAAWFPHAQGNQIQKIDFDKIKIYSSSTQTGSYTLLSTVSIQVDLPGGTIYSDPNGLDTTWYKTSYYNSTSFAESDLSDPIQFAEGPDGYLSNSVYNMVNDVWNLINQSKGNYVPRDTVVSKLNIQQQNWWFGPYAQRDLKATRTYLTTQNQAYVNVESDFDKIQDEWAVMYHHVEPANSRPSTAILSSAGNLSAGKYYYVVSFVLPTGETPIGTPSVVTSITSPSTAGQIQLTGIPIDGTSASTARKIYRTQANGSTYTLLTTISDNTTTTYTDNSSDASIVGNASPVTGNPALNNTDAYHELEVLSVQGWYEKNSNNLNIIPNEDVSNCAYFENGTTKRILLGTPPASSSREVIVRCYIKPTDMANDTDTSPVPVIRLLTLPTAIEILISQGQTDKVDDYRKELATVLAGLVNHGRPMAGSVSMRFRKDYGRGRYISSTHNQGTEKF